MESIVLILGVFLAGYIAFFSLPFSSTEVLRHDGSVGKFYLALPFGLLFFTAFTWGSIVKANVPEPYLDEIFHIPQAQRYCQGKWLEWDDKITTPPGLYCVSVFFLRSVMSLPGWISCRLFGDHSCGNPSPCDAKDLRMVNVFCIVGVAIFAAICRGRIEGDSPQPDTQRAKRLLSSYALLTGINIALMPILFFFCGLYYTDVMSTLAVLVAYAHHLDRVSRARNSILSDIVTIVLGASALCMRQTNVFWVVVYMGGLEAVHAIKTLTLDPGRSKIRHTQTYTDVSTLFKHFLSTYSVGDINDPSMDRMAPDDVFFTIVSLVVAAVCNPFRVLRQVWPHITIMALFTTFVAWNGGVVLGDKSNHVATLHLAQMLYIWPLFVFLSWPIMLVAVFPLFRATSELLKRTSAIPKSSRNASSEDRLAATSSTNNGSQSSESGGVQWLRFIMKRRLHLLPAPIVIGVGTLMIIKYNTIVHPFTLADNRHYMFYVARYTIRRSLLLRYQLSWFYLGGAVLALVSLAPALQKVNSHGHVDDLAYAFMNRPFLEPGPVRGQAKETEKKKKRLDTRSVQHNIVLVNLDQYEASTRPTSVSTMIMWLLATTLSLITAPLIEPRYFIIPWAMWRLLLPAWTETEYLSSSFGFLPFVNRIAKARKRADIRLFLETLWFLVVNLAIMAIFILNPFQWRAEDGSLLDEGRLQRFMW